MYNWNLLELTIGVPSTSTSSLEMYQQSTVYFALNS